jgi:hypothetical protein
MSLSVNPATPFSNASLPNHTRMFELKHVVTSMDDFGFVQDALRSSGTEQWLVITWCTSV